MLWGQSDIMKWHLIDTFHGLEGPASTTPWRQPKVDDIDWVPPSLPPLSGRARLVTFEDNEAVIKMVNKARAPSFRHIPRTHIIDVDFILNVLLINETLAIKYIGTKEQMGDIFTKGQFSSEQWQHLLGMMLIGPIRKSLDS